MSPSTRPYVFVLCSTLLAACGYVPVLYDPKSDAYAGSDAGAAASGDDGPAGAADGAPADGFAPDDAAEPPDAAAAPDGSEPPDAAGPVCENDTCNAQQRDGCCPSACNASSDLDCIPRCGNGVVETGERCDPPGTCPASCPNRGCTRYALEGAAERCTASCVESGPQTACRPDDGCCPAGCTVNDDDDCQIVCGNGVKEGSETCDPLASCPTTCPAQGCQLRKLVNGGTCSAACADDRRQTACLSGDGCCPPGCNATNDGECAPACGNGVVERGETCEPVAECTRRQAACTSDQNTLRTGRGSAAACTFECQQSPRPCGPADGACPSGCGADPNCLPRPASCTHIQFCRNPNPPNVNQVICITNDDARCTDAERLAECAREATTVCGANHVRPVIFRPPIGGRPSG
jgi:hypothetical protein